MAELNNVFRKAGKTSPGKAEVNYCSLDNVVFKVTRYERWRAKSAREKSSNIWRQIYGDTIKERLNYLETREELKRSDVTYSKAE